MLSELARRQRLGDQGVVVHRHGVQPDPADQAAERVRAQRGLAGGDRRVRGRQGQPGPVAPDAEHRGLLEDPYPGLLGRAGQAPRQPGRVDQREVPLVVAAGQVGRGVHLGAHRGGVEDLAGLVPQPADLVRLGGHDQRTGPAEVAVDLVRCDGLLDLVQVGPAQRAQLVQLIGEMPLAVALAVGQRGRAEPAVAAAGGPADPGSLGQHDVPVRVALPGQQRGPQPGEPAAHDGQVSGSGPPQPRPRARPGRVVQPERRRRRVSQRGVDAARGGSQGRQHVAEHDISLIAAAAEI